MLLTALHTRSNGPRRQRAHGYRENSNNKNKHRLRGRIGRLARPGIGWAGLPPVSRVTLPQHRAVTCSTTNGRAIFDKDLTQGTVAQMSRRLAHFADEQRSKMCLPSALRRAWVMRASDSPSGHLSWRQSNFNSALSSKNRRLGATRLPTEEVPSRPGGWPGKYTQRCELVMRRVSGGLEKWRGASSLSQDLARNLVRIRSWCCVRTKEYASLPDCLGHSPRRRQRQRLRLPTRPRGAFSRMTWCECPDLGKLLWDDFLQYNLSWVVLWKVSLPLGPSWDLLQPCSYRRVCFHRGRTIDLCECGDGR